MDSASGEIEASSQSVIAQLANEPDDEALIVHQIKNQDKDKKAQ